MKTAKYCPKNSGCQLWQVLCDGNPCVVDKEIKAYSHAITGRRSSVLRQISTAKRSAS